MDARIPEPPENFKQIICDLTADLTKVYPEYAESWEKWNADMSDEELTNLFQYCLLFYPTKFFDILNKNEDIFENDSGIDTNFLPNVEFKALYNCEGVSQNTRETIWKYLQLILFSSVKAMNDSSLFGDTAKMFENINTDDLKSKMEEAFKNIDDLFHGAAGAEGETGAAPAAAAAEGEESDDETGSSFPKFDPQQMHDHINNLLNGKLGKIAKELVEEISEEFNDEIRNMMDGEFSGNIMGDTQTFLNKFRENPGKLMDMVKKIVAKLREKMDSGEMSQNDFMQEISGIMNNLKNIPGLGNFESIFKQFARSMGGGGGGAGTRVDTNAMERMSNHQKMKEKLRARMEAKNRAKAAAIMAAAAAAAPPAIEATPAALLDDSWMDEPAAAAAAPQKSKKAGGGGKKKK